MKTIKKIFERIKESSNVEACKAYADCIELILNESKSFSLKIVEVNEGCIIPVIRELRSIFALGLKEAKDAAEQGFTWHSLTQEDADRIANRLKSAGAIVDLS